MKSISGSFLLATTGPCRFRICALGVRHTVKVILTLEGGVQRGQAEVPFA